MPLEELHRMMYSIAARFHFPAQEIWGMRSSELRFWYEGHKLITKEEEDLIKNGG